MTRVAQQLGRPIVAHPDAADASLAAAALLAVGVKLTACRVDFTDVARLVYNDGPWPADLPEEAVFDFYAEVDEIPAGSQSMLVAWRADEEVQGGRRRLAARTYRGIAALRATELWRSLSIARRARLLSGGGLGAGAFWHGFMRSDSAALTNAAFRVVLRRRLLLDLLPGPTTCAFEYSGTPPEGHERVCGRVLDAAGMHALCCPVGPHRIRLHNEIVRALAEWVRSHGGYADMEVAVPDLYKTDAKGDIVEARMDLVISWPGAPTPIWVDVTVRSPDEDGLAARVPAHCARAAERHKRERYSAAVVPFAVETEGRLGPAAQALLSDLAASARVLRADNSVQERSGADFARQIAAAVSSSLVSRLAELLLAAGQKAAATLGGVGAGDGNGAV